MLVKYCSQVHHLFTVNERLHDFVIYTSTTMPQPGETPNATAPTSDVCGFHSGPAASAVITTVSCGKLMVGQFVIIQIPGQLNCLTLCEVEIYSENCFTVFSFVVDLNYTYVYS